MSIDTYFHSIDNALKIYYEQNGYHDYRDDNGYSEFMTFIVNEQLNDTELPIEAELGDNCDPNDCTYCWMYNNIDCKFPVPKNIKIPDESMETYIFYVLQYCYKENKPPTTQYITQEILLKVPGATHEIGWLTEVDENRIHKSVEGVSHQATIAVSRICETALNNEHIIICEEIEYDELSISSRFERELERQLVIAESLIDDTDWFNVIQIGSKTINEAPQVMISLDIWIEECKKSFGNTDFSLIPVLINSENNRWIEWIKIIRVESQGICVGVSLKYNDHDQCKVQSICLDKGEIYRKHRLVGLINSAYTVQLNRFDTSISKIIFKQ
eukprot:969941_1